ncbi:hypothetical protein [Halapricum hydrolyticum]|uniref:Uncharacterized protein n=1 Tax=Halapricum hydrolyticum TaxID=2979991 RepID=A0AAE3IA77_9EURY|nr:hypothetical protein [Halapricum hydrolyticum]MCU4718172.1 hypothetical protein [Halapricum hydrolyticum]MCU4726387.1 hypothetical protein [Halapricum hydrolyticum]
MTPAETPLTSKAELNAELKALLLRAYENGLDVKGAFECRNGVDHPDWDVVVTEVEKNESSE